MLNAHWSVTLILGLQWPGMDMPVFLYSSHLHILGFGTKTLHILPDVFFLPQKKKDKKYRIESTAGRAVPTASGRYRCIQALNARLYVLVQVWLRATRKLSWPARSSQSS